jgi:ABC-2 type transport system permease protein
MIRLVRGEIYKLRTIWSTWAILGIAMVLSGGFGTLVAFGTHHRAAEAGFFPGQGTPAWFDIVFSAMGVAMDLALVLGILMMTGEYRHKTVTPTYLAEPQRGRVVASKLIVSAGGGLVVGVAGAAMSLILGFGLVAGGYGNVTVMLTEYKGIVGGVLATCVAFALYGLGLGALLKNQVVALVVGLGVTAIVEPIIVAIFPSEGRWMPGQAALALESLSAGAKRTGIFGGGSGLTHILTWWEGGLALLGYAVALSAAGALTTLRSDVT